MTYCIISKNNTLTVNYSIYLVGSKIIIIRYILLFIIYNKNKYTVNFLSYLNMYFNHNIEIIFTLASSPLCPSPTPVLSTCLKVIVTADVYKSNTMRTKRREKEKIFRRLQAIPVQKRKNRRRICNALCNKWTKLRLKKGEKGREGER